MHDLAVTIVAVATPPGRGGIGCVRLSGSRAHAIARALFRGDPERGAGPFFGEFLARDGSGLDHGYLVLFPEGRSFTGEETAELWPHGSPPILAELVAGAIARGAEPAGPGEFAYRALRHGRLDIVRAEAIRDLVAARTLFQARSAFAQVEGALSRRLAPLREALEDLIARTEAAVEFCDEEETHLRRGELTTALAALRTSCDELLRGFARGRVFRDGASVTITGLPNVGKSSLFNRLLEQDRAIVAATPGTTRDVLEETIDVDGIPVSVADTAGMRDVEDEVEIEGVRRARAAREQADLIVLVLEAGRAIHPSEREVLTHLEGGRTLVVVNKSDLEGALDEPLPHPDAIRVSAGTGLGLDALRRALRERLVGRGPLEDPILSDARHGAALDKTRTGIDRAIEALASGLSEELVLEDLREAMASLGEITGEFAADDLYERIFSTFCIGK